MNILIKILYHSESVLHGFFVKQRKESSCARASFLPSFNYKERFAVKSSFFRALFALLVGVVLLVLSYTFVWEAFNRATTAELSSDALLFVIAGFVAMVGSAVLLTLGAHGIWTALKDTK